MFSRFLAAFAILLVVAATMPVAVQAQSSFGRAEQQAPRNEAAWRSQAERKIRSATRRANSTLHIAGDSSTSAVVMMEIVRDGRVTNVQVMKSTGKKTLDAAITRSYLQIGSVAPFSPDMQGNSVVITIDLGTRSG